MSDGKQPLKDSGQRREFETGAVRDMSGADKGRYDLIPPSPLRRLALTYQKGAVKYGENNWQKGIPVSSFIDSATRHLEQVKMGAEDEDHAAQAAWNIFALMWTLEQIKEGLLPKDLDNRIYKVVSKGNLVPEELRDFMEHLCMTGASIVNGEVVYPSPHKCEWVYESEYVDSAGRHITYRCTQCGTTRTDVRSTGW